MSGITRNKIQRSGAQFARIYVAFKVLTNEDAPVEWSSFYHNSSKPLVEGTAELKGSMEML